MRYSSYGNRDSQHAVEGDMSFVRMITRLNPEQLRPGEVAYSQNGRMDNNRRWEPRTGINTYFDEPEYLFSGLTITKVYGACRFISKDDGDEFVTVLTDKGVYVATVGAAAYNMFVYFQTALTATSADIIQAFDHSLVFSDGETALKRNHTDFVRYAVTSVTRSGTTVTVSIGPSHPYTTGDIVSLGNITGFTTNPNGAFELTATTATTISFTQAGDAGTNAQNPASAYGTYGYASVSTTATVATSDDDVTMTVSNGLCTVSVTSHGRASGDVLTVYDGGGSGLVEGDRYEIAYIDADSYSINAEIPDGTYTVTFGGKQPISGGYIAMPNPAWGFLHENRLIVPYDRAGSGDKVDELVFSDVFDFETFDPIVNQLRFGGGAADEIIGLAPFTSDRLVVLCRNSIHIVDGVSGSLADMSRYELTPEVGCVARKSITVCGASILWLSDQGVYEARYGEEYRLLTQNLPLSEPIENEIRGIAWASASKAVGLYDENRYYLAVPLTGSTENNAVFVYNFLNAGWESIDTFPSGFNIVDLVKAKDANKKSTIYAVDTTGTIHELYTTAKVDSITNQGSDTNTAIAGYVKTRGHVFGNFNDKHFTRASVTALDSDGTTVNIKAIVTDPDSTTTFFTTSDLTSDSNVRRRIRDRGRMIQLQYEAAEGGIKGYSVDAWLQSMADVTRG